jgi:hypothetical protein
MHSRVSPQTNTNEYRLDSINKITKIQQNYDYNE